tara:strand:+ start:262 stop:1065 length:804 start_codon:yes stop_codon:yes gene_type:complete
MTTTAGSSVYQLGVPPVVGTGVILDDSEFEDSIAGPVRDLVGDSVGIEQIESVLSSLPDTEFNFEELRVVIESDTDVEPWRVGEAIAEAYLVHHRGCMFPWPDGRDERKSGSSLPGADLVGFGSDDVGSCFAYGEVKTSSEEKYPPGAMYGAGGLKQQLEDLQQNEKIRDDLLKYLAHRAAAKPSWLEKFKESCTRYLNDKNDLQVYGVMVRDVDPDQDDLRVRVEKLGESCPALMKVELLAIYLPNDCIPRLSQMLSATSMENEDE